MSREIVKDQFNHKLTNWRERIIKKGGKKIIDENKPGGAELAEWQRYAVEAAESGSRRFARYLLSETGFNHPSDLLYKVPKLINPLTWRESAHDTVSAQVEFDLVTATDSIDVRPSDAVQPAFWSAIMITWMTDGTVPNNWTTQTIVNTQHSDNKVRMLCRRIGGLPHVRGNTSVLTDCTFGRAWWRVKTAQRTALASEGHLEEQQAYEILRDKGTWTDLADDLVKRAAVMCHPRALAAVLVHVRDTGGKARQAVRRLGSFREVVSFTSAPFNELVNLCPKR